MNLMIEDVGVKVHVVVNFCCDAPAKADVRLVKQFNARQGCERCSVSGTYMQHRMVLETGEQEIRLRDDSDFDNPLPEDKKDREQHVVVTNKDRIWLLCHKFLRQNDLYTFPMKTDSIPKQNILHSGRIGICKVSNMSNELTPVRLKANVSSFRRMKKKVFLLPQRCYMAENS